MIFDKPVLASNTHQVGDKTLVLYELSADVYYDHVLNPEAMERWVEIQAQEAKESSEANAETDEPDYVQMVEMRKADKESQLDWVACSLLPGYPDSTFEAIRAEIKANLNVKNLAAAYQKAFKLGTGEVTKKPDSLTDNSSTD